jgi:hypothetical protein
MGLVALAGAGALLVASCREPPRAWELDPDAAPPSSSGVTAARYEPPGNAGAASDASLLAEAGGSLGNEGAGSELDGPAETPVRVGGPWVRCYGNFRPSGQPVKDVTRLSLLCGPENGMRRMSPTTLEGSVSEGSAPASSTFSGKRGECYRVFAVAEPSVADLDVTIESSRGAAIAADHGEDAWPIVQPDRPFCPLEDDTLTLRISARRGAGRFAAEVWRLRTPSAADRPARARSD